MEETKSKKGFNYAMIALILFALAFILAFFEVAENSEFFNIVLGILALTAILVGVFGLISSIQGLKEPNSMEQIVGITLNGIFTIILIYIVGEVISGLT